MNIPRRSRSAQDKAAAIEESDHYDYERQRQYMEENTTASHQCRSSEEFGSFLNQQE